MTLGQLTIFTDFPYLVVLDWITLAKRRARATLVEGCAVLVFGLVVIASLIWDPCVMGVFVHPQVASTMTRACSTCGQERGIKLGCSSERTKLLLIGKVYVTEW